MTSAIRRVQESRSASYQVLMELTKSDFISRGDVAGAAAMLTEMTCAVVNVGRASVWLFETNADNSRDLVAVDLFEPGTTHQQGIRFPERLCPHYCRCLDDHRLLSITDAVHDVATRELAEPYLLPCGIGAVLDAPIYCDGKAVGVVCHAHKGSTREWSTEECFFAASLADIMAITIANQQREATRQKLMNLEYRHQLAVEAGGVGVWTWHVEHQLFWANDQFWKMIDQKPYHGSPLHFLRNGISPRDVTQLKRSIYDIHKQQSQILLCEHRWESSSPCAALRWFLTKGQVTISKHGTMLMGTTIDMTERKLAEESQQRILVSERSAQQLKDRFLGNMSHELRTPLNGIMGMAQLLQMTHLDKEQQDFTETILTCGHMLLSTFNNMLDLTKLEAHQMCINLTQNRMSEVLSRVKKVLWSKVIERKIVLTIHDETHDLAMHIDADRLIQVIVVLTDNAIKFSHQEGVVMITARRHEDGVRSLMTIDIQDQGPGISPLVENRLFTPFATHDDSTTRKHQGNGLGLAIAKKIMHLLGGDVMVYQTGHEGTIMRIKCPATPVSNDEGMVADHSI